MDDKEFNDFLRKRLIDNQGGGYQTVILAQRRGEKVREIKERHKSLKTAISCALHTAELNRAKAVFVYSLAKDGKTWRSVDQDGYVYSDERPFDHLSGGWIDKAKLIDQCNSDIPKIVTLGIDEVRARIGM